MKADVYERITSRIVANGERRCLLLGNGFSITHFNYQTLLEKSGLDAEGPLRALFTKLNTVDFELIIRSLEHASLVERTYNKEKRAIALQSTPWHGFGHSLGNNRHR